jgi:hypothetical protein
MWDRHCQSSPAPGAQPVKPKNGTMPPDGAKKEVEEIIASKSKQDTPPMSFNTGSCRFTT